MWENVDQNNSEYGHFSRSEVHGRAIQKFDYSKTLFENLEVSEMLGRAFQNKHSVESFNLVVKSSLDTCNESP